MNPRLLVLALACAAAQPAAAQLRVAPAPAPAPAPSRPASSGPRAADYIVAVVNSVPITNNEVRARLVRFEQQLARQGATVPPRAELARIAVDRLISEKAQLQVARDTGIRVDESAVDAAEQNFARQNQLTPEQLRRRLEADGVAPASFREDLRNQLLLTRLREREVDQRVKVSEQEVDEFLREVQDSRDVSRLELNLAHILVALPDNPNAQQLREARDKAERALQRVRAGEDFAKVAAEMSDAGGAASNGGQIGLRSADRLPPVFLQATQGLQEGGVTPVFQSPAGLHVVKVVERRPGGLPSTVTQTLARHILLRPNAQVSERAALQRLAELRRQLQAGGASFEQLAREHSQDASASRGGDLGWANPGTFVPEFEEALAGMSPGQVSEPVVSRFGVHLIQLVERRTVPVTDRERREVARDIVREKKLDEAYERWAQDVRGRAYVELREPPQ